MEQVDDTGRAAYNGQRQYWTCTWPSCKSTWLTLADAHRHYDTQHKKLPAAAKEPPKPTASAKSAGAVVPAAAADQAGLVAIQRIDAVLAKIHATIQELEREADILDTDDARDDDGEGYGDEYGLEAGPSDGRKRGMKRSSPHASSPHEDEYIPPSAAANNVVGGLTAAGSKRQRRTSSVEDRALKAAASRYMHLEHAWLTPEATARMFKAPPGSKKKKKQPEESVKGEDEDGEGGETSSPAARPGDAVELTDEEKKLLDAAKTAFAGEGAQRASPSARVLDQMNRKVQHLMTVARAETTNRLRTYASPILSVPAKVVGDLDHEASAPLLAKDALGWCYTDVDSEEGYLRCPRMIEAVSMVMYGQLSLGKKSAAARARAGESNKGSSWRLQDIPPALVALVVTVMRSVVKGEKSFRLTSSAPESLEARDLYLGLLEHFSTTSEGQSVLEWLKGELLPPPKPAGAEGEGTVGGSEDGAAGEGGAAPAKKSRRKRGSAATSTRLPNGRWGGTGATASASASGAGTGDDSDATPGPGRRARFDDDPIEGGAAGSSSSARGTPVPPGQSTVAANGASRLKAAKSAEDSEDGDANMRSAQ
ncbi:hypothetical protein JCM8202_004626 [Rhodotorula sphaerocarpa]